MEKKSNYYNCIDRGYYCSVGGNGCNVNAKYE